MGRIPLFRSGAPSENGRLERFGRYPRDHTAANRKTTPCIGESCVPPFFTIISPDFQFICGALIADYKTPRLLPRFWLRDWGDYAPEYASGELQELVEAWSCAYGFAHGTAGGSVGCSDAVGEPISVDGLFEILFQVHESMDALTGEVREVFARDLQILRIIVLELHEAMRRAVKPRRDNRTDELHLS